MMIDGGGGADSGDKNICNIGIGEGLVEGTAKKKNKSKVYSIWIYGKFWAPQRCRSAAPAKK